MTAIRIFALIAILSTNLMARHADKEVNEGTAAYKTGHYAEAVAHFQRAVDLDPSDQSARLYLATAYLIQWVPGLKDAENQQKFDSAQAGLQAVLAKSPDNPLALAMMASMAYNSAMAASTPEKRDAALEEAVRWNRRRTAANPDDEEPYYYLGVIDWAKVYTPIQAARVKLGMPTPAPGPIPNVLVRSELQSQYSKTIEDGILNLKKCLELAPDNEDAMTYLNLLLRKKADLENSAEAAQADLAQADDWANKAIEGKRRKAGQAPVAKQTAPIPPPPLPPAPRSGHKEFRIGGMVAEKNIISKVQPNYPQQAKALGVQGSVEFTVVIGEDGSVRSTQLVHGHPLLVEAARNAVMQWKYRPTLLNGLPIEITTDVVVNFTLVN